MSSGEVEYGLDVASPEELWDRLSEAVKARISLRAGQILEWWASPGEEGRPAATVLGTDALIRTEPTEGADGRPANRITVVPLVPSSLRRARVQAPNDRPVPHRPGTVYPRRSEFIDVLTQLPPDARELLERPFADAPPDTVHRDQHYSGVRRGRDADGVTLRVWYYLLDQRTLAFATGLGHEFRVGAGAASWDVTCWLAAVKQPAR